MKKEIFETERLYVRHLTEADLDVLYAVYSDAEAMRWVDDGQPITWGDCVRWVDITQRNYATHGYGMCALVLKALGDVIGFCGVVHPGGQEDAEIKYALLREYWGIGLATEAVQGMLAYARTHFDLQQIIATIDPENDASRRVLQKSGMMHVHTVENDDGSSTETLAWRFRYVYSRKPVKCPQCKSSRIARILYGMPAFSEKLNKDLEDERIVLGGCCILDDDPSWQCVACGINLYRKPK